MSPLLILFDEFVSIVGNTKRVGEEDNNAHRQSQIILFLTKGTNNNIIIEILMSLPTHMPLHTMSLYVRIFEIR